MCKSEQIKDLRTKAGGLLFCRVLPLAFRKGATNRRRSRGKPPSPVSPPRTVTKNPPPQPTHCLTCTETNPRLVHHVQTAAQKAKKIRKLFGKPVDKRGGECYNEKASKHRRWCCPPRRAAVGLHSVCRQTGRPPGCRTNHPKKQLRYGGKNNEKNTCNRPERRHDAGDLHDSCGRHYMGHHAG